MKIVPLLFTLSIGAIPILEKDIEINPMQSTPFNDNVEITIENRNTIGGGEPLFLKVRSHPVGANTYSESMEGMRTNPKGVTVLLIFNGKYRMTVANIDCSQMVEEFAYFNRPCQIQIPGDILNNIEGKFVVNAIAVNSYNESIKARGAMAVKILDYGTSCSEDKRLEKALKGPYVLYNQPYGTFNQGEPVLLDFYLSAGYLSQDGDKVELYIDGEKAAVLTSWIPYEIVNLPRGEHTIKLILIGSHGQPYPSPFPVQENTIYIK